MKLSEAAQLCEGTSRPFAEVYKLYNFKDEDDLRAYCDFVIHEPVEWMRGFPVAWKSPSMFSKPRAAFHRLMKLPDVIEILGADYCENVYTVVWNAFKTHMATILEKRTGLKKVAEVSEVAEGAEGSERSSTDGEESLTAESFETESVLEPAPPVPAGFKPKNSILYTGGALDYKQKYEALQRVLATLLSGGGGDDESARLRRALTLLLSEYARV